MPKQLSTDISSVFYAMYVNKKVFLVRSDKNNKDLTSIYRNRLLEYTDEFIEKNRKLFEGEIKKQDQKKLASIELGENFMLKPSDLKKVLGIGNPIKDLTSKILSKIIEIKQGNALKVGDL